MRYLPLVLTGSALPFTPAAGAVRAARGSQQKGVQPSHGQALFILFTLIVGLPPRDKGLLLVTNILSPVLHKRLRSNLDLEQWPS